jgi:hypothetical protein
LFVQVTFVPTLTVRLCGLKAKLAMETLLPPLPGAVVAAVVGVGVAVGATVGVGVAVGATVGDEVLAVEGVLPPHAASVNMRPMINTQNQVFATLVAKYFCIIFLH